MAADKRAIDFGKIKRYIKNKTAEFYIESLSGEEKEQFKSVIKYLDNVTKTKHLSEEYDTRKIEEIKDKLNGFAPTKEQLKSISSVNRNVRDGNTRARKIKAKKLADKVVVVEKPPFEKISKSFWALKTLIEQEGMQLSSKEIETVKKNLLILAKHTDTMMQERIKMEIQQAYKQAEEIKSQIEKLNNKMKTS